MDHEREGIDLPLADLKQRVNNLLWLVLPPSCTLEEAERLAVEIYEAIIQSWINRPNAAREE